jgi:hypothetical protein
MTIPQQLTQSNHPIVSDNIQRVERREIGYLEALECMVLAFLDKDTACPAPATVTVWLATNGAESCHFGSEGQALAYARSRGTVQRKEIPILSVATNPTRSL